MYETQLQMLPKRELVEYAEALLLKEDRTTQKNELIELVRELTRRVRG